MAVVTSSRRSGRDGKPRQGDQREGEILDAAELVLGSAGLEGLTMEAIARRAGLSRSALYFYFDSRQTVLTALVERTATALVERIGSWTLPADLPAAAIARLALSETAGMWRDHGPVMRAAVEQGDAVPEIGRHWRMTVERSVAVLTDWARRERGRGARNPSTVDLVRTLSWMTERNFYALSVAGHDSRDERRLIRTLEHVWLRSLARHPPSPANGEGGIRTLDRA